MLILARLLVGLFGTATALGVLGFAALLALTALEPRPLSGAALQAAPAARAYEEAERAAFSNAGVSSLPHALALHGPVDSAHAVEAGDGSPVVLLNGLGTAVTWAPLMSQLGRRHVFAVDRPGTGLSDGFDYAGVDVRHHAVDFVHQTLTTLKIERAVLVGNGVGGTWVVWYALAHPERVAGVVLVGTPAGALGAAAPEPLRRASEDPLAPWHARATPSPAQVREQLTALVGAQGGARVANDIVQALSRAQAIPGSGRSARSLWRAVYDPAAHASLAADDLAQLKGPVLWLWGDADAFADRGFAERAKAANSHIEWVVLGGAGHAPWLDDPSTVSRPLAAFVDRVAPTPIAAAAPAAKAKRPSLHHTTSAGAAAAPAAPGEDNEPVLVDAEKPAAPTEPKPTAAAEPKPAAEPKAAPAPPKPAPPAAPKVRQPVDEDE